MESPDIVVRIANAADADFALPIAAEMEASAKVRGTGIAKRSRRRCDEDKRPPGIPTCNLCRHYARPCLLGGM